MTVKRGTNNIRNRLSESDVLEIYSNETQTQHELATRFGVSQSTINHIRKGRTWVWLTKHGE